MVNGELHPTGESVAYVSQLVANYNAQQHEQGHGTGDEPTEPGWYVDGIGPFATRVEACRTMGVDPDSDDWEYAE